MRAQTNILEHNLLRNKYKAVICLIRVYYEHKKTGCILVSLYKEEKDIIQYQGFSIYEIEDIGNKFEEFLQKQVKQSS